MKKFFSLLAVAMMVTTFQVGAQVTVKSNGFMDIGENPDTLIEQMEAFYNRRDTISALRLFGPGEQGTRARISFGDAMAGAYKFVMVGEMENYDEDEQEYLDTDQLWLPVTCASMRPMVSASRMISR